MDAVGTPWKRHGLPRHLHYDLTARPRDTHPVVFEVMVLDWFPLVTGDSVGGGTSYCLFRTFSFSHRFPSSPLTSPAVFLKANIQMSETLFLFCLQAVRAVLERRGSAMRTPRAPRKGSENVVQAPWNAT